MMDIFNKAKVKKQQETIDLLCKEAWFWCKMFKDEVKEYPRFHFKVKASEHPKVRGFNFFIQSGNPVTLCTIGFGDNCERVGYSICEPGDKWDLKKGVIKAVSNLITEQTSFTFTKDERREIGKKFGRVIAKIEEMEKHPMIYGYSYTWDSGNN